MVGSRNIKTPAMDVPVKLGARDDAKKLQKQFNKVYLSDVSSVSYVMRLKKIISVLISHPVLPNLPLFILHNP